MRNIARPGTFVVSLDFELLWGVRDIHDRDSYGGRILGGREAIPGILDLFERYGVRATWATVGFLLCESKDELLARRPRELPTYADSRLSNYSYLDEVGADERRDPYFFGASLARRIAGCPGQELGTHTFSHYYTLEPGQSLEQFRSDLEAAVAVLRDRGAACRSIVFPRNQFGPEHVEVCRQAGIVAFRGTERAWCYRPAPGADQGALRRLTRLADAYVDLTGANAAAVRADAISDVPASRFLRPYARRIRRLEPLRLRRIQRAMEKAGQEGRAFHLWWHPHNFGADREENLGFLEKVLGHFATLRDSFGMRSMTMAEAAAHG